jgi:serine/threonine protein kinase
MVCFSLSFFNGHGDRLQVVLEHFAQSSATKLSWLAKMSLTCMQFRDMDPNGDDLREMVARLEAALAAAFSETKSPTPRLSMCQRLLVEFVKPLFGSEAITDVSCELAWFCAHCAVVDQRVVDLQLKHCNDDILRKSLYSVFARAVGIREVLVSGSNSAAAVKRKLDALLVVDDDQIVDVTHFSERVRMSCLDDIDVAMWTDVTAFFSGLARARRQKHPSPASNVLFPLIDGASEPPFTEEQLDALLRFYDCSIGQRVAVMGDKHSRLGAVLRDGDGVPYLVADEDRQRLVHVARRVVDLRQAIALATQSASTTASATMNSPRWSLALHCSGGTAALTMLTTVNDALCVNVRLFDVDLYSCSMADAINCVTLMIGIRTMTHTTALSERIGEALFGDGVRAEIDAALSTYEIAKTRAKPAMPPSPSMVPSARRRTIEADEFVSGTVLADRKEHMVVRSVKGDVVVKAMFVDKEAVRCRRDVLNELRLHELLSRRAAPFVVPLLAHFEGSVRMPGTGQLRESIVLVMPVGEPIKAELLWHMDEIVQCADGLLAALAALHELRVLHNDVKWSNTLRVGAERRVVLCDFGFSTAVDVEGGAAMQIGMGTEGYMAPEVRDGWDASVTTAADVYSAGIALGKLRRAHDQCAAMRTLVNRMCSSYSYMRPSAAAVLDVWRREVTPALLSTVVAPPAAVPVTDPNKSPVVKTETRKKTKTIKKQKENALAATKQKRIATTKTREFGRDIVNGV